jgi:hypothetical protein
MKKKMMFVAAAVALISLASCKKDYECYCSTGGSEPIIETHKGKDAADACASATKPLLLKSCTPK